MCAWRSDGVAATMDEGSAQVFRSDFEAGMEMFYRERPIEVPAFHREIAVYFAQFAPLAGNLYGRLLAALGGTRHRAIFASLNYDMLLEGAAYERGLLIAYRGFPVEPKNIPVLKIHGSCNFLPDLSGFAEFRGNVLIHNRNGDYGGPVRFARSPAEIVDFCQTQDSVAPAISMYAAGKRVLHCPDIVNEQQQAWLVAAEEASRIFVIGVRVHPVDTHVWEPLARASGPVYYVGLERDVFTLWGATNRLGSRKSYALASTFKEAMWAIPRVLRSGA